MYKLERKIASTGVWYDFNSAPFKTRGELIEHFNKYCKFYPEKDRLFRLTNLETGGKKVLR